MPVSTHGSGDNAIPASVAGNFGVSGDTTLAGALAVGGAFAVDTDAFTVADSSGNTTIKGDLAINTDAFTVAAATGNTTVKGTLAVTGACTFTGGGSFVVMPTIPVAAVNAAGANQGNAAALSTGFNVVSLADDTTGVKLPAAAAGKVVIVKNAVGNKTLKLYPGTDDAINAGAANAEYGGGMAGGTSLMLIAADDTTWHSLPLADS